MLTQNLFVFVSHQHHGALVRCFRILPSLPEQHLFAVKVHLLPLLPSLLESRLPAARALLHQLLYILAAMVLMLLLCPLLLGDERSQVILWSMSLCRRNWHNRCCRCIRRINVRCVPPFCIGMGIHCAAISWRPSSGRCPLSPAKGWHNAAFCDLTATRHRRRPVHLRASFKTSLSALRAIPQSMPRLFPCRC